MNINKKRIRIKAIWDRRMIRPLIYKIFTRGVLMLTAVLLWQNYVKNEFVSKDDLWFVAALIFALQAVVAFIRLDGVKIPQVKLPRIKRKQPPYEKDMADYINDDIVLFDDLDEDEQSLCVFMADIILMVVYLIASLF